MVRIPAAALGGRKIIAAPSGVILGTKCEDWKNVEKNTASLWFLAVMGLESEPFESQTMEKLSLTTTIFAQMLIYMYST